MIQALSPERSTSRLLGVNDMHRTQEHTFLYERSLAQGGFNC